MVFPHAQALDLVSRALPVPVWLVGWEQRNELLNRLRDGLPPGPWPERGHAREPGGCWMVLLDRETGRPLTWQDLEQQYGWLAPRPSRWPLVVWSEDIVVHLHGSRQAAWPGIPSWRPGYLVLPEDRPCWAAQLRPSPARTYLAPSVVPEHPRPRDILGPIIGFWGGRRAAGQEHHLATRLLWPVEYAAGFQLLFQLSMGLQLVPLHLPPPFCLPEPYLPWSGWGQPLWPWNWVSDRALVWARQARRFHVEYRVPDPTRVVKMWRIRPPGRLVHCPECYGSGARWDTLVLLPLPKSRWRQCHRAWVAAPVWLDGKIGTCSRCDRGHAGFSPLVRHAIDARLSAIAAPTLDQLRAYVAALPTGPSGAGDAGALLFERRLSGAEQRRLRVDGRRPLLWPAEHRRRFFARGLAGDWELVVRWIHWAVVNGWCRIVPSSAGPRIVSTALLWALAHQLATPHHAGVITPAMVGQAWSQLGEQCELVGQKGMQDPEVWRALVPELVELMRWNGLEMAGPEPRRKPARSASRELARRRSVHADRGGSGDE